MRVLILVNKFLWSLVSSRFCTSAHFILNSKKKWLDCCHTAYQCGCDNDAWDHHNEWKPYHTDRTCVVSLQCAWKHAVTAQLVSWRLYHSLQLHTYGASLLDALGDEPYRDQKMKTRDHAGYIQVMGFSLHSRTLSTFIIITVFSPDSTLAFCFVTLMANTYLICIICIIYFDLGVKSMKKHPHKKALQCWVHYYYVIKPTSPRMFIP